MNIKYLEDRIALKELVDKISILGDKKNFENQVQLFSENAISETIAAGKTILKLEGRKEMIQAFENFLQNIETVYHFNGQQVVTIDGDNAVGKCYCLITLIGNENGKKIKTTIGATYEDQYIRENNKWLVAKRVGTFEWQDKIEIKS
jgi:translation initiation factor RLI1